MRHKNKKEAIAAALRDYEANRFGVSHRAGCSGVTFVASHDGVYRHERNDAGGTAGIACPSRRLGRAIRERREA